MMSTFIAQDSINLNAQCVEGMQCEMEEGGKCTYNVRTSVSA